MLDFVFEDGFGFERYVDYLLDVPMYFSYRDGKYIDLAGKSFRDFLAGKLPELPGALPTLKDWADHMTTAFPEVRLKKLSGDARRRRRPVEPPLRAAGVLGRPALRRDRARCGVGSGQGFLDRRAPCAARRRAEARAEAAVPQRHACATSRSKRSRSPRTACKRRARRTRTASTRAIFLDPLIEIAEANQTPAERKLELFHGEWNGDIDRVFREFAY